MKEVDNEADLVGVLKGRDRVLALFYASWCPFCRSFLPIFERHAGGKGVGELLYVRVDDEENSLCDEYGVEAVPTVIYFVGGRVFRRLDGRRGMGLSEKQFEEFLESV